MSPSSLGPLSMESERNEVIMRREDGSELELGLAMSVSLEIRNMSDSRAPKQQELEHSWAPGLGLI